MVKGKFPQRAFMLIHRLKIYLSYRKKLRDTQYLFFCTMKMNSSQIQITINSNEFVVDIYDIKEVLNDILSCSTTPINEKQ
ncbi:CLUMA_CG018589, isoform A [Clunio marinus]|uniref:CLUMA_CG018589, isoform A n=1 Tax=Clunio marinus TaxID=568069 RepID=A0A1J1J086_9DIPT|nr:CLUMA_CG018589, isoform A [Clunio marinus]